MTPLATEHELEETIELIRYLHPVGEGTMSTGAGAALVNEIDRLRARVADLAATLKTIALMNAKDDDDHPQGIFAGMALRMKTLARQALESDARGEEK